MISLILLGATISMGIIFLIMLVGAFFKFAREDMFIGYVPEGTIKFVMAGESVYNILSNVEDYSYNPSTGEMEKKKQYKLPWERYFGIYVLGLWPIHRIFKYQFKWDKFDKKQEVDGYTIVPRDEEVTTLYFRYPYPIVDKGVEIKGFYSVDVTTLITFQVKDPHKALFKNPPAGSWLATATAKVKGALQGYLGGKEAKDLLAAQNDTLGRIFFEDLKANLNPELIEQLGVEIVAATFEDFQIEDPEKEVIKALQAQKLQEQIAEGKRAEAAGKRDMMIIEAEGEAQKIFKRGEARAKVLALQGDAEAGRIEKLCTAARSHPRGVEIVNADMRRKWRPKVLGGTSLTQIPLDDGDDRPREKAGFKSAEKKEDKEEKKQN